MEHDDIYERLCKPEFSDIKTDQKKIIAILKGEDGEPGLCEHVRDVGQRVTDLEKAKKTVLAGAIFVIGAICLQFISDGWGFISSFFKGVKP